MGCGGCYADVKRDKQKAMPRKTWPLPAGFIGRDYQQPPKGHHTSDGIRTRIFHRHGHSTVKLQTNLHIFYGKRGPTDARQGDALHLTVPFRYADNSPRQAQYSTQSKR